MKLTTDQVKKFQALYRDRFGVHLSDSEASEQGRALVGIVKSLRKPVRAVDPANENYDAEKQTPDKN